MAKAFSDVEMNEIQGMSRDEIETEPLSNGLANQSFSDSDSSHSHADEPCYKRPGFKRITFGCIIVVLIIVLIAVSVSLKKKKSDGKDPFYIDSRLLVKVPWTCGNVTGKIVNNVTLFKAIPYAKSLKLKDSFKPPQPLDDESCTAITNLDTTNAVLHACKQMDVLSLNNEPRIAGQLDCLKLNVYTPDVNETRPVLVYIHGGWLLIGSGSSSVHVRGGEDWSPDPSLARQLDAVVVTVNYRLALFGWVALDLLESADGRPSGNYGLQDQILALKWIRENIAHFGGDPDKITLLGHGSGGTCALALLTIDETRPLIHRAWAMSPSASYETNKDQVYRDNFEYFLNKTGCQNRGKNETLQCLRGNMDPKKALRWSPYHHYPNWAPHTRFSLPRPDIYTGALIFTDGEVLKKTPFQALQDGSFRMIPLVLSHTDRETDLISWPKNLTSWNSTHLEQAISTLSNDFSLSKGHSDWSMPLSGNNTIKEVYAHYATTLRVTCPLVHLYDEIKKKHGDVYRLVTTTRPSRPVYYGMGAFTSQTAYHGWDLHAMFGTYGGMQSRSSSDVRLGEKLRQHLKQLVHEGNIQSNKPESTILGGELPVTPKVCDSWLSDGVDSNRYIWKN